MRFNLDIYSNHDNGLGANKIDINSSTTFSKHAYKARLSGSFDIRVLNNMEVTQIFLSKMIYEMKSKRLYSGFRACDCGSIISKSNLPMGFLKGT